MHVSELLWRARRRKGNSSKPGAACSAAAILGRQLRVEPLECRQLLSAVSWDGGGNGTSWNDPFNWSGNALPSAADDVTISVAGAITVTHASGNTTIRSVTSDENLVISGGTFTLTNGASVVNGSFTISTASLTVAGSTSSFTAAGAATIDFSTLTASGGAQLNLTSATTYAKRPSLQTTIEANGSGSKIDLSGVTSITGTASLLHISAQAGGEVELDGLTTLTAPNVGVLVGSAGSVVDFNVLASWIDPTGHGYLSLGIGGTVQIPSLTTFNGGSIHVSSMAATFPAPLTNIDGTSLSVLGENASLSLPAVTSWAELQGVTNSFDTNGVNSKLDLSGIASITGTTGSLQIVAAKGGEVELDGLTTLTGPSIHVIANGTGSVVDFLALTSWTPGYTNDDGFGSLRVSNGGTVQIPALTTMTAGSIYVTNMSATFPAPLTNINMTSLYVSGANASLSLPAVTSWAGGGGNPSFFKTDGANSKLDLSGITSITGPEWSRLQIQAYSGGEVVLDGLTTLTAANVDVLAGGGGSVVNLMALTSWTDATNQSSLLVGDSGHVQLGSSTTLAGVSMEASLSGTIAGGTIQLNTPSTLTGSGGTIEANFVNAANILPGASPGKLNFIGDSSQTSVGALSVELNGLIPITGYDQIAVQGTVTLDGTLAITRGFTPAIGDSFTIIDNDGVDAVIGTFFDAPEGEIYTVDTIPFRLSYVGGDGNDVTLTRVANTVVGRLLFYNQSGTPTRYDGNNAAVNAADDLAIATDKTAYQWEDAGAATFANVSSYTKGINGIMVDLAGSHGSISAADFVFRVGNNNSPGLWDLANAPASISVRAGAGRRGSDRIEIIWTSGAPTNQWLEVITLANAITGLPQNVGHPPGHGDAFFYGSAVGNTGAGDSVVTSLVNSMDEAGIRGNNALLATNIPITNVYDVNRSASVNASDESVVRLNGTNPTTATRYLNLSSAPAAPESEDGRDADVASALAAPARSSPPGGVPLWLINRLHDTGLNSRSAATLFQHLDETNSPRTRSLLPKFDPVADVLGLDDMLLESLLIDLGLE